MPTANVQLLIGPPASGKTTRCLQILQARREKKPGLQACWLLPDESQVIGLRRQLAAGGSSLQAQLATFSTLQRGLLERTSRLLPQASEPALFRVIQSLARQAAAQDQLPHYAGILETPGFINALADRFAELKRERVDPQQFLQAADAANPGETELAGLYDRYQAHLQAHAWADREGLAWLAVEMLAQLPDFNPGIDLLLVDGFNEFTPVQLSLLQALLDRIPEIVITLTGQPGEARSAHGRFVRARWRLEQALAPQTHALARLPQLTPELAALEAGFFEPAPPEFGGQNVDLHLLELRSPAEEAREALRWIKALLLRQPGLLSRQAAIFIPEIDLYLPYLQAAAAEFNLPLHSRFREPLAGTPEIQALTSLLELPAGGFLRRPVLECVRSPFFDLQGFNLRPWDAAVLEALSYEYQVVGGLDQWRQAFARLRQRPPDAGTDAADPWDADEILLAPRLPGAADAARLAAAFEAFFAVRLQPPDAQSLAGWLVWLEELLETLQFSQRCSPPVLDALQAVLAELLRSEALLAGGQPGEIYDYAKFIGELLPALRGQGVILQQPAQDEGIFVGPLIEARGLRFEAVALLGLGEGLFPAVERADPFLGEALRGRLGMAPRLGRDQSSLFYQAALRSNRYLLLTRPYLAEGGEPWQPSPYWQSVVEVFPGCPVRLRPADPRKDAHAASTAERLLWRVRQGYLDQSAADQPAITGRETVLQHKTRVLAARLARTPGGPYEGQPAGLEAVLARRYGEQAVWSASRFETYGSCPLRFYVQHALHLEPLVPPRPGFEPVHLGSILHELLEQAYRFAQVPEQPGSVITTLHDLAGPILNQAPTKYGFRPGPLWEIEQDYLLEMLEASIHALAESGPEWQPAAFEARFGLDDQPPLELPTGAGIVRLRGLIDRVDTRPGGGVRVIDYKSGGSHLSSRDLLNGVRLQLPLYAAAARALGLGEPVEGFYWNLRKAEPGALRLSRFTAEGYPPGFPGALELVVAHLQANLQGIRQADFTPQPPAGGCPSYCPAVAWCWRYEPSSW